MKYCGPVSVMIVLFALSTASRAQTPVSVPPISATAASSGVSDSIIGSAESDHIFPGIQGASGGIDWLHAPGPRFSFVLGASSQILGKSRWTLGHAGAVWFHSRWTLETSMRVGRGSEPGGSFHYQDYVGAATYRLSTHLYSTMKEEYVNVGSSHGHLIRGGICACNLHRLSSTLSAAHSAAGNLGTEFVSIREETYTRNLQPFFELSVGKMLPRLISPALDLYTVSASTISASGGTRVTLCRSKSLTLAAASVRSGQTSTLSLSISIGFKLRGE